MAAENGASNAGVECRSGRFNEAAAHGRGKRFNRTGQAAWPVVLQ